MRLRSKTLLTTGLYHWRSDEVSLDEVERILILSRDMRKRGNLDRLLPRTLRRRPRGQHHVTPR